MIIKTRIVRWFLASVITLWPFILIDPNCANNQTILAHERVHLAQQKRWAIYGLGVGLLVWYFLYLFCLPAWYNPWRRRWESEAYTKAQGYNDEMIAAILRHPPYYLV